MSGQFTDFFHALPIIEMTDEVVPREFTNKQTGQRERNGVNQMGYLVQVDKRGVELRRQIRVPRGRDQSPYVPGSYVLSGSTLNGNEHGDIEMKPWRIELVPVPQVAIAMLEQEAKRAA